MFTANHRHLRTCLGASIEGSTGRGSVARCLPAGWWRVAGRGAGPRRVHAKLPSYARRLHRPNRWSAVLCGRMRGREKFAPPPLSKIPTFKPSKNYPVEIFLQVARDKGIKIIVDIHACLHYRLSRSEIPAAAFTRRESREDETATDKRTGRSARIVGASVWSYLEASSPVCVDGWQLSRFRRK